MGGDSQGHAPSPHGTVWLGALVSGRAAMGAEPVLAAWPGGPCPGTERGTALPCGITSVGHGHGAVPLHPGAVLGQAGLGALLTAWAVPPALQQSPRFTAPCHLFYFGG